MSNFIRNFQFDSNEGILFDRAFNNALNLIAGTNGGNSKTILSEKFRENVEIEVCSDHLIRENPNVKGLTGKINDDKVRIRLANLKNHASGKEFQHNATHEIFHAWTEVINQRRNLKKINGADYKAIMGTIYKKMTPEEERRGEGNKTYGGAFNECMMDILSECAFVGYDSTVVRNTNVDEIIKNNKWYNNKGTAYARMYDLTGLMVSAFSNNPNFSYQRCIDDGNSVAFASHKRNGQDIYENDFITGTLIDSFIIQEKYDEIMGNGKYFELCEKVDYTFDKMINGLGNNRECNQKIEDVVDELTSFTAKKCSKMLEDGIYTREEARKIFEDFTNKRDMVYQKYNLQGNEVRTDNEINKFRIENESNIRDNITPNDINNATVKTMRNSQGQVSSKVNSTRSIFSRIFKPRDNSNIK